MHETIATNRMIVGKTSVVTDPVLAEIINGLQNPLKFLPSKLFYDERGSKIFEKICELEEYYPTRTETAIMQKNIHKIAEMIGPGSVLIEYGSGSSKKTRILLDHFPEMAAYIPVDISRDHLLRTAESLKKKYPGLAIKPVWADYTSAFEIPPIGKKEAVPLAYFPGSTIGNFYPNQAIDFLKNIAELVGPGGGLLIGVDLKKDPDVLNRAYNDSRGVNADFNLNMLRHINNLYNANFDLNQFDHNAIYNQAAGRIEMYLISKLDQTVYVGNREFYLKKGERTLTEVSYKYSLRDFKEIANAAGFTVEAVWKDPKAYFSVQYLKVS